MKRWFIAAGLMLLTAGATALALVRTSPVLDVFTSLYWVRFENDLNRPIVVQWRVSVCRAVPPDAACFAPVKPEVVAPGSTLSTSLPGEEGLPTMYRLVGVGGGEIGCVWLDEDTEPRRYAEAPTILASDAGPCPPRLTTVASPLPGSAPLVGAGPPHGR